MVKRACLLIHGWMTDVKDFDVLENYLYFYDKIEYCKLPGHNDEPLNHKLLNPKSAVDVVLQSFDRLAEQGYVVDVVGYSLGGALATFLAGKRKVNKIVLVAPANHYINWSTLKDNAKFLFQSVNTAYRKAEGTPQQKWKKVFEEMVPWGNDVKFWVDLTSKRIWCFSLYTYAMFAQTINFCNQNLRPSSTPALILWGELDQLVPESTVFHVQKYFSNNRYVKLKGVSHLVFPSSRGLYVMEKVANFLR